MNRDTDWIGALRKLHPQLSDHHITIIQELVSGFARAIEAKQFHTDFIDKNEFDYLTARLVSHHSTSSVPLKKENFEHALEYIFRRNGKDVPSSTDPTRRGADIVVNGSRVSLKTFSAKFRSRSFLDISKFAECRWLREPLADRDAEQIRVQTIGAIQTHLREYDRIFMFSHYSVEDGSEIVYELYEIPKTIFESVSDIGVEEFAERVSQNRQTITLSLVIENKKVANLSLDGSVEKIRFLGISTSSCSLHGRWKVQLP